MLTNGKIYFRFCDEVSHKRPKNECFPKPFWEIRVLYTQKRDFPWQVLPIFHVFFKFLGMVNHGFLIEGTLKDIGGLFVRASPAAAAPRLPRGAAPATHCFRLFKRLGRVRYWVGCFDLKNVLTII